MKIFPMNSRISCLVIVRKLSLWAESVDAQLYILVNFIMSSNQKGKSDVLVIGQKDICVDKFLMQIITFGRLVFHSGSIWVPFIG